MMCPPRTWIALAATLSLMTACTPEAPQDGPSGSITTTYAPQNRPDVRGTTGAVSGDHPLAAQAGLRVLQNGGKATDAIIAMAGVLAVVRPHMGGIVLFSGSLYLLVFSGQRWLGAVTPIGGVAFMIGWALLAWTALRG